ncbi:HIRAN domain-containing protein [Paenibacillus naphthalenovorans]|uniref:HIRAN domain-containing protein n=1 Tax=Paenibacillus naphthalenovorans TaxID=162209 RepID=UPI00088609FE|nr:HIRAN domain-containing protein [Paenibacillus naphthalenovorans]SDJ72733.1 HIRAN domain-containing protein [Paenibacillus naphthalenovorans]
MNSTLKKIIYGVAIIFFVYIVMKLLIIIVEGLFNFVVDLTTSGALLIIICGFLLYRYRGKLVGFYKKNIKENPLMQSKDNKSSSNYSNRTFTQESMKSRENVHQENVDSNKTIMICPHCSQENRVQKNKLHLAVCGRCKKSLSKYSRDKYSTNVDKENEKKKEEAEKIIIVTCPFCFQQNNVIPEKKHIAICGNCKKSMITPSNQSNERKYGEIQENFFIVRVAGVTYENRQEIIAKLNRSTEIFLKRDYNNQHDPYAVGVYVRGSHQIGWIPKEYSKTIGKMIDQGTNFETRILDILGGGNGLNYGVEIEVRLISDIRKSTRIEEKDSWEESVWDEYDEDGIPYSDYPEYKDPTYYYDTIDEELTYVDSYRSNEPTLSKLVDELKRDIEDKKDISFDKVQEAFGKFKELLLKTCLNMKELFEPDFPDDRVFIDRVGQIYSTFLRLEVIDGLKDQTKIKKLCLIITSKAEATKDTYRRSYDGYSFDENLQFLYGLEKEILQELGESLIKIKTEQDKKIEEIIDMINKSSIDEESTDLSTETWKNGNNNPMKNTNSNIDDIFYKRSSSASDRATALGTRVTNFMQGINGHVEDFEKYLQNKGYGFQVEKRNIEIPSELGLLEWEAVDFIGKTHLTDYSDAVVMIIITFLPEMILFRIEDIDYLTESEKIMLRDKDLLDSINQELGNCKIMDIGQDRIAVTAEYSLLDVQYNSEDIFRFAYEILTKADECYYAIRKASLDNL